MEQAPEYRIGYTLKELDGLLDEDEAPSVLVLEEAAFIEEIVEHWSDGYMSATEACRELHARCLETENRVPDDATAMLLQTADVWFPYEADLSVETVQEIRDQECARVLTAEIRNN